MKAVKFFLYEASQLIPDSHFCLILCDWQPKYVTEIGLVCNSNKCLFFYVVNLPGGQ